jgi:hypothetical protein
MHVYVNYFHDEIRMIRLQRYSPFMQTATSNT